VTKPVGPYTSTPAEFSSTAGPRCPYIPATALAQTALAGLPGIPGTGPQRPTGVESDANTAAVGTSNGAGIGSVNSPQENQLIAELMGPQAGVAPSQFPRWGSLLLGPALRGAQVSVR
jgi:phospholipid/cholesterol/gamma-HCH transport system substrate-binding protein